MFISFPILKGIPIILSKVVKCIDGIQKCIPAQLHFFRKGLANFPEGINCQYVVCNTFTYIFCK